MIYLNQLISHRFRGFAPHENTVAGLIAALDFGVRYVEFDIRVTRCGTPIVYHDEYAYDGRGQRHYIHELDYSTFPDLGGAFARMPMAEALFTVCAHHPHRSVQFLIDVKDGGFEDMIHALVSLSNLQSRSVYVSWLPSVLYAFHWLDSTIPLCLSHWSQRPSPEIRSYHKVYRSRTGHIEPSESRLIHGERSGWWIEGPVRGAMKTILQDTDGYVCVPQSMVSREWVSAYQADNIKVSTFAYTRLEDIRRHQEAYNIDLFFVDNKSVFEKI